MGVFDGIILVAVGVRVGVKVREGIRVAVRAAFGGNVEVGGEIVGGENKRSVFSSHTLVAAPNASKVIAIVSNML